MKKRMLGLLMALSLVTGLMFAMTGTAAANPCLSELTNSPFIEVGSQQTNCANIEVNQTATGGVAVATGPFSNADASASNASTVNLNQINAQ
jgi:hypothetical protein